MNSFKNTLALWILLFFSSISFGQKIKYKDLFVLLNAKQYDQAEPFLKSYLAENQDNPNAFLFMGYIFEEKALASDVLTELTKLGNKTDSAVIYFDRAYQGIDDKELRKNDEYYQVYSRRDLRTGKFGLKLPDVQLDLEKRTKYLKDRRQRVAQLHEKLSLTQRIYGKCEILYADIASRYKDKLEFYLRSDDVLKSDLVIMGRRYDSCLIAFNDYKNVMVSLGKTGHNQEIDPQEVKDFKKDGYTKVDFIQDEIKFWDFKRWALSNVEIIDNEVTPIRESLVKMDAELNALREKLRKDSVSLESELHAFSLGVQKLGIAKYDPRPMPIDIFNLKIKEIKYGSHLAQTRNVRDTTDLKQKLGLYKEDFSLLSGIDSMANLIIKRDLDYDVENYKSFIKDSYGSATVLKSVIKTTGDFAITEKAFKENRIKSLEAALDWIVDKSDSIPVSANVKSLTYSPLSIVPDKYTLGLQLKDSVKSYFYVITPSRQPTIRSIHRLDTSVFNKKTFGQVKALSLSTDPDKFYFLLYSEIRKAEKIPAFIFQVAAHEPGWSNLLLLDSTPTELTFSEEAKSLSIKIGNEPGAKTILIDKNGKIVPGN